MAAELTLRASFRNAAVKVLIDNGVARSRLGQPWIYVQETKEVCGGFGIGCDVCGRMIGRNQALFPPR